MNSMPISGKTNRRCVVHLVGKAPCNSAGSHSSSRSPTVFDLLVNTLPVAPLLVSMDITIDPNTSGLPGINQLRTIVGAVMTIGLILSVLAERSEERR